MPALGFVALWGFSLQQSCGENGGKRIRTDDPLLAKQVLYQLSYAPVVPIRRSHRTQRGSTARSRASARQRVACSSPRGICPAPGAGEMGQGGLEPPTPRLSSVCSNQLSYWPPSPGERQDPTGPSSQPRPDHGMGEGCADGADPERSGTPREITRWPAELAGCDGEWIGMRQAPSPPSGGPQPRHRLRAMCSLVQDPGSRGPKSPPHTGSLKGGDPAAGSPTATLLRLHPSH